MRESNRFRLRGFLVACFLIASGLTALIVMVPAANYIWRAYFYPGSNSSIRGYPTVDPPSGYTGSWTHFTFTGQPVAILNYIDGETIGKQTYLKDDGTPYLIRYVNQQGWERDEVSLPLPEEVVIPGFFPQRWINPSLNRKPIEREKHGKLPSDE